MTIDSINGQKPFLSDVVSVKNTVSTIQQKAFEQRLNNVEQPQYLVGRANQALTQGEPKVAAQYLGEAAQQISDAEVTISDAGDYE